LAVAITTAVASLSWVYFEKPIVRWSHKRRYDPPATFENAVRDTGHTSERVESLPGLNMAAK
jgi:peptidoglycan/LPS O-acetylase OafA/YrhL